MEEFRTYEEWRQLGFYVRKGEKATRVEGKAQFSRLQVEFDDDALTAECTNPNQ